MKAISARASQVINLGAQVKIADNSGARIARIVGVKRGKTRKGQQQACRVADLVKISIKKGPIEMKKQLFWAVILRQKKEYKRKTGERICFEDNAIALLKDEDGNPKGTQIKGPIAKETADRWPFVQKIAQFVV